MRFAAKQPYVMRPSSSPVAPLYTLSLGRRERRDAVVMIVAHAAFLPVAALVAYSTGGWFFFGLLIAGVAAVFVPHHLRILRGPRQIEVLPGNQVQFTDWFGRSRIVGFGDISSIALQQGFLRITAPDHEFLAPGGFDGLSRFVTDVSRENGALVTRGI